MTLALWESNRCAHYEIVLVTLSRNMKWQTWNLKGRRSFEIFPKRYLGVYTNNSFKFVLLDWWDVGLNLMKEFFKMLI